MRGGVSMHTYIHTYIYIDVYKQYLRPYATYITMDVLFSTVCPCIDACTYWLVSQCHNITAHKHHVNHVYIMCLYIIDVSRSPRICPCPGKATGVRREEFVPMTRSLHGPDFMGSKDTRITYLGLGQ